LRPSKFGPEGVDMHLEAFGLTPRHISGDFTRISCYSEGNV